MYHTAIIYIYSYIACIYIERAYVGIQNRARVLTGPGQLRCKGLQKFLKIQHFVNIVDYKHALLD